MQTSSPSSPNNTPPRGLPNATETPAAAAAAKIFRFCAVAVQGNIFRTRPDRGEKTRWNKIPSLWRKCLNNLDNKNAIQHATCTSGPYEIIFSSTQIIFLCLKYEFHEHAPPYPKTNPKPRQEQARGLWWAMSMGLGMNLGHSHLKSVGEARAPVSPGHLTGWDGVKLPLWFRELWGGFNNT